MELSYRDRKHLDAGITPNAQNEAAQGIPVYEDVMIAAAKDDEWHNFAARTTTTTFSVPTACHSRRDLFQRATALHISFLITILNAHQAKTIRDTRAAA